jgi:hypothetical protein
MYPQTVQFTINVRDTSGNNYNVGNINPNELEAVQKLLQYKSTWINMIGGNKLHNYDVDLEFKNHMVYVKAQLQIEAPIDKNIELIIENGKRNFNNYLSAEYMLLDNGDTIGMNLE